MPRYVTLSWEEYQLLSHRAEALERQHQRIDQIHRDAKHVESWLRGALPTGLHSISESMDRILKMTEHP
jgi:hypothetical protein